MINVQSIKDLNKPIIGMVHLLPLPGSPTFKGNLPKIYDRAFADAEALKRGGVDALLIENAGDVPTQIGDNLDVVSIAIMATITKEILQMTNLPIGVNCITNSVKASFAVCLASGASFIRSTAWTNGYISPTGYVPPAATDGLRYRNNIIAEHVKIMADVQVKNGSHFMISDKSLLDQCSDIKSNLADYVVVTGKSTGIPPDLDLVKSIKENCGVPVILGSGANDNNIIDFLNYCDGVIVGTSFKNNHKMSEPVNREKVVEFMELVNNYRQIGE